MVFIFIYDLSSKHLFYCLHHMMILLYHLVSYPHTFQMMYILSSDDPSYYTMMVATLLSSLLSFNIDIFYEVLFDILVITLWWTNIAIENGHLESVFPSKIMISIVMLVHQTLNIADMKAFCSPGHARHAGHSLCSWLLRSWVALCAATRTSETRHTEKRWRPMPELQLQLPWQIQKRD